MFKKIINPIILLAITAGVSTAYAADPLQDFKAGTWKGTYFSSTSGCAGYKGDATLVVTNPIYNGSNPSMTSVTFGGTLMLSGPLPSGYSDFSQPVALNQAGTSITHYSMGYGTSLYPVKGPAFTYSPPAGYDDSTQEIRASGTDGCSITIDVFPAG